MTEGYQFNYHFAVSWYQNILKIMKWYITYTKGVDGTHLKEFICGYLSKLDL